MGKITMKTRRLWIQGSATAAFCCASGAVAQPGFVAGGVYYQPRAFYYQLYPDYFSTGLQTLFGDANYATQYQTANLMPPHTYDWPIIPD